MKNKIRILTLAVGLAAGQGSFAQGIPVIDAANLANSLQQVIAWGQQYQQMTQQIQQLKSQIDGVTGGRGFSTFLNSPLAQQARRMLPQDAQTLLSLANGGSYGNLSSSINSIKQASTTLNSGSFTSSTAADQWQADLNRAARQKALSMEAYTDATQRLQNLEGLIDQISQTQDPKAISELNARIATEQGIIQNEQAKLQAMSMLVAAEQQLASQKAREISIRSSGVGQDFPKVKITQ